MVQREMEFSGLRDVDFPVSYQSERERQGGIVPPSPVLAPGSALGWRPRVALSSAQVSSVYPGAPRPCKSLLLGPGSPLGVGRRQFLLSCGPDCLGPTCQPVGKVVRGDCMTFPGRE